MSDHEHPTPHLWSGCAFAFAFASNHIVHVGTMYSANTSPSISTIDSAKPSGGSHVNASSYANLSQLPAELLVKILLEQASTQRWLRSVRLVCRALDDVVKHSVVEYIRLGAARDIQKIEAMTSQPNTFHTSTRTVRLDASHAVERCDSWKAVAALFRRMEQVRTIHCIVPGHLSQQMICAIGASPMLDSVRLTFLLHPPSSSLRLLESFLSRLKSLALDLYCFRMGKNSLPGGAAAFAETEDAVCDLIAKGSTLEHLEIVPSSVTHPMELKSLVDAVEGGAENRFSLRTIVASAITIPILPQSARFLANISSLEIPNTRQADQDVWSALQRCRVKLKAIKIDLPSPRLIDYVRGYRGLRSFQLGGPVSDYKSKSSGPADQLMNMLLSGALPEHRTTMVDLRIRASGDPSGKNPNWQESLLCVNTDILRPLHRFRNLERLHILYSLVKVHLKGGTTLHYVLNTLTALSTKLRTVWFHSIGVVNADLYKRNSDCLRNELELIEQFRFSLRPSNWRELRVVFEVFLPYQFPVRDIPPPVHRVAYEVVCDVSQDKYRLEMDLNMTEILNEARNLDCDTTV